MSDRWFRLPTVEHTTDEGTVSRPKHVYQEGVIGFSGNKIGNSPQWFVRVFADTATLDDIAAQSDAEELDSATVANLITNANVPWLPDSMTETEVDQSFRVEGDA